MAGGFGNSPFGFKKTAVIPGFGDDVKITGKTTEFDIGIRKYLLEDHVRFFIEGGVALISATVRIETSGISISGSDSTTGFWYGAGADIMLGNLLSIGVLGRVSNASLTANGVEGEIGGRHINIFITQHFGKVRG